MGSKTRALSVGELHPRESLFSSGNLGSLNAEIVIPCDGCASVAVDLRGTFSLTAEVSGTIDGVNWSPIPLKPVSQANKRYVAAIAGTTAGVWAGVCSVYRQVRIRATAYTSGAAAAFISASNAPLDQSLDGAITTDLATSVGAAAAAVTLTIPAPGAGLRQYLTYLSMTRVNGTTTALTPSATPVTCTTLNLPGSLAFTRAADALAGGAADLWREDFAYPLAAGAQNTSMTITCPATPGVIWRVTAGFYVAP